MVSKSSFSVLVTCQGNFSGLILDVEWIQQQLLPEQIITESQELWFSPGRPANIQIYIWGPLKPREGLLLTSAVFRSWPQNLHQAPSVFGFLLSLLAPHDSHLLKDTVTNPGLITLLKSASYFF